MKLFGLIIADAGSFVADLVLKVVVALVSVLVSGIGEVVIEGAYQLVNNFLILAIQRFHLKVSLMQRS